MGEEPYSANSDSPRTGMDRAIELSAEWRSRLLLIAAAGLAFCTLTGLLIWLAPFGVFTQMNVLLHTAGGLLLLAPCVWYTFRHIARYWRNPLSHVLVLGYAGGAASLLCLISGIVVTWNGLFGTRLSYVWDRIHLITTVAIIAFVATHLVVVFLIERKARAAGGSPEICRAAAGLGRAAAAWTLGAMVVVALAAYAYVPVKLQSALPDDYSYPYGKDRPFAPSLATTPGSKPLDDRLLSGSASCGTSGCHEEIAREWEVSAHRYSAMDAGFQAIQMNMAKQNGPESTRYCGGCHDPISLFSGTKNLFTDSAKLTSLRGYREGVSCLACHSLRKVDLKGNANYIVATPPRYLFELEYDANQTRARRVLRDFLIRTYPRQHLKDLSKRLFKTPEYCAACHKQFVDREINKVGWVQLQNQYDNWRQSRWNHPGNPRTTIECRECHMPLEASKDPAAGDSLDYNRTPADGKHRSHRFIAANQLMPPVLKLPGWEKQMELTEKWLQGKFPIPEIADKWSKGPAVALELVAPDSAAPGSKVPLKVMITSNKVGHDFPTGPLDIIQAWVEIEVKNAAGDVVFTSGSVNEKHFIAPGAFMFKAEPVDQNGSLIDRHNLWEMVGVRYRRALFPGFSDSTDYEFICPSAVAKRSDIAQSKQYDLNVPKDSSGRLTVHARLRYRKVDQYLLNFIFGEKSGLTSPITDMTDVTRVIEVGGCRNCGAVSQVGGR